jgi:hypothetical protein
MTTLHTLLLFGFLLCAGIGLTVGAIGSALWYGDVINYELVPG